MTFTAYFDETEYQNLTKGAFIVAGLIAEDAAWAAFEVEWKAALERHQIQSYKFFNNRKPRKQPLNEELWRIIESHVNQCFFCVTDTVALDKSIEDFAWNENIENIDRLKKQIRNPYFFAVKSIIIALAEHREKIGINENINSVFDMKTEAKQVNQNLVYLNYSASVSERNIHSSIGYVSFQDDECAVPLQAADLYAGWLRRAYKSGIDLKIDSPFPWPVKKGMHVFSIYQNYDFFIKNLEFLFGKENLDTYWKFRELEANQ